MKILVTTENGNLYTKEIAYGLSVDFDATTDVKLFFSRTHSFDIVHIQWPEELTNWQLPGEDQLEKIADQLRYWKSKGTKIVATRHNELPHKPTPILYKPLYDCVYSYADAIIHLGEYSKLSFPDYPGVIQKIIPHHVYETYRVKGDKRAAREKLGIALDAKVMLCFGGVRNRLEQQLISEMFDNIPVKKKYLLAPSFMRIEVKDRFTKLVAILKHYYNKLFRSQWLGFSMVPEEEVWTFFQAADIVFVPRVSNLNSGIPFLAFAFGRVVVGPDSGNIGEVIRSVNCFVFNPENKAEITGKIEAAFDEASKPGKAQEIIQTSKKLYSLRSAIEEHEKLYYMLTGQGKQ